MTDAVTMESRLHRAPYPGEYRGIGHTEACCVAVELVKRAAALERWHHLPEHLTQLRAIMDVTAGTMTTTMASNAGRTACATCSRWIDALDRDPCTIPGCEHVQRRAA